MTATLSARVYRPTPANLSRLARVLAEGGLVAAPTETVYGLAADALNARACRAIFRAKGRPANDPLIVHVDSLAQAADIAELNDAARAVAKAFWPGPLTLVLPKKPGVPAIVTSGLDSVAVRMPAHRLFRALIRRSGCPLAAPSANPFGYVSPTTAAHVRAGLGSRIGHILDGGPSEIGVESTILDLRNPKHPALLRPGAISREALETVLKRRVSAYRRKAPESEAAPAPGMLERHYSPRTPLTLVSKLTRADLGRIAPDEAILFLKKPAGKIGASIFWLTSDGSLEEAAHRLFDVLRQLDDGRWRKIHAELIPGRAALAMAVNDRLARAAAKR
ncbi:MAG: threonylcarbamoyl-AMP synthase [Verrucomicrobia bacterium]|nr:threonylcarbamoyl-AMP synthase [Verrucomicrobiota bacterium]